MTIRTKKKSKRENAETETAPLCTVIRYALEKRGGVWYNIFMANKKNIIKGAGNGKNSKPSYRKIT